MDALCQGDEYARYGITASIRASYTKGGFLTVLLTVCMVGFDNEVTKGRVNYILPAIRVNFCFLQFLGHSPEMSSTP